MGNKSPYAREVRNYAQIGFIFCLLKGVLSLISGTLQLCGFASIYSAAGEGVWLLYNPFSVLLMAGLIVLGIIDILIGIGIKSNLITAIDAGNIKKASEKSLIYGIGLLFTLNIIAAVLMFIINNKLKTLPSHTQYSSAKSNDDSDIYEKIRKLGELKEEGLISKKEFKMKKKQLLGIDKPDGDEIQLESHSDDGEERGTDDIFTAMITGLYKWLSFNKKIIIVILIIVIIIIIVYFLPLFL